MCYNNVTRQINRSVLCIDHFSVKRILPINIKSYVFLSTIKYHFSTVLSINLNTVRIDHQCKSNASVKVLSVIDLKKLNSLIINHNWCHLLRSYDINDDVNTFLNKSETKISRKFNSYNQNLKPWITKGIIVSIRHGEKCIH